MCAQHQQLLDEEKGAWAALSSFIDQLPTNATAEQTEELSRLTGIAANVTHSTRTPKPVLNAVNKNRRPTGALRGGGVLTEHKTIRAFLFRPSQSGTLTLQPRHVTFTKNEQHDTFHQTKKEIP